MSVAPLNRLSKLAELSFQAERNIQMTLDLMSQFEEMRRLSHYGNTWKVAEATGGMTWGMRRAPTLLPGEKLCSSSAVGSAVTDMLNARSPLIVTLVDAADEHTQPALYIPPPGTDTIKLQDLVAGKKYEVSVSQTLGNPDEPYTRTLLQIKAMDMRAVPGIAEPDETHYIQHLYLPWYKAKLQADGSLIPPLVELRWARNAQWVDCLSRDKTTCPRADIPGEKHPMVILEGAQDMAVDMGFLIVYSSLARSEGVLLPLDEEVSPLDNPDFDKLQEHLQEFTIMVIEYVRTVGRVPLQAEHITHGQLLAFYFILEHMKKIPVDKRPVQGLEMGRGYANVVL